MMEGESTAVTETGSISVPTESKPEKPLLSGIIHSQIVSLKTHHRTVLETGEPEAIHKMRVTTRRLQASIDLLLTNNRHSQKDKTERYIRKLKRRLRKWRRKLSLVRNYDVFLSLIDKEIGSRRGAHRKKFELLKNILTNYRETQSERIRGSLEAINIQDIANRLGIVIEEPPSDSSEADSQNPDAPEPEMKEAALQAKAILTDERRFSLRAAQRLEQRIGEFHALAAEAHSATHPEDLHQLRIAAKRVRYLLEILSERGMGNPNRALAWLRSLQDRIGDWHDLEALEEEIISILSRPGFMKEHLAESSSVLHAAAHLQKRKVILVSRLFPIKVPTHLRISSERLIRSLRRKAAAEGSLPEPDSQ